MDMDLFDPDSLEQRCRRDLAGALRQLAEHLDDGQISGSFWSLQGNGMLQDWRREHFLLTPDHAVTPQRSPKGGADT